MTRYQMTLAGLAFGALAMTGCTSHLLFVEEDHIGLKATFEANNPSPVQVTVGYRRGIVAIIPQKSQFGTNSAAATPAAASPDTAMSTPDVETNGVSGGKSGAITIHSNTNELMSLYSTFNANIGFNDPIHINHFLATGSAASSLLANHEELRTLTEAMHGVTAAKDSTLTTNTNKGGSQ